ncbi:hypothetical protein CISIN_1g0041162mg, partial [Citrus sinensis]
DELRECT